MELLDLSGLWMAALGKTIVHSLWIGLLILSLLRIILIQIPAKFSNLRYGLSVTALLLIFCSVIGIFLLFYKSLASISVLSESYGFIPRLSANLSGKGKIFAGMGIHQVFNILGEVYFIGILAMIFRTAASFRYIGKIRTAATKIDPQWHLKFLSICKFLGITHSVDFLESTRIQGPVLVGFLKPAVIIPAGMIANLPFSQVETILMHELYHLKRMDYLVNMMQLFLEGLLFFNPAIWIISGIVRNERENCCDDGVLDKIQNPVNYVRALIHIAERQQFNRLVPGATGTARNHFKSRINRILKTDTMKTSMRDRAVSLALLAGSMIILLVVNGFSAGPSFISSGKITNETTFDTIPQTSPRTEKQAILDEIEEIDWEKMKAEIEDARQEAIEQIEEIDWEKMKAEIEDARQEAIEQIKEIDWEKMKAEIEEARQEAIEQIKEIDWEKMKAEIEEARQEALEQINEIDWDEIKNDVKNSSGFNDSVRIEIDH
jgi:bla regulator protein BlaR1